MRYPSFIPAILALLFLTAGVGAQTQKEVLSHFTNLRSDDIPNNCGDSLLWIFKRRDKLKAQMLEELYGGKADQQERDALLLVLFKTESFVPDKRFAKFVMLRLPEQDKVVRNEDIYPRESEKVAGVEIGGGAHHEAWEYIDAHFDLFELFLAEQIGTTNDMWCLWTNAWIMNKRGVLASHLGLYTPEVLARVAANLRNDEIELNASQAARLFLLLGDRSLPALRDAAKSKDAQQNNLARALLDAITKGDHRAFGYLNAKLSLDRTPFGPRPEEPEWIGPLVEKYLEREKYP